MSVIKYFKKPTPSGAAFYKVNTELGRITHLEGGKVVYPDFEKTLEEVMGYKKIRMDEWKQAECGFFMSRHFVWEHQGKRYSTTDKPIEWKNSSTCGREAIVFHNGKIWVANDYYYPRIQLTRIEQPLSKSFDQARETIGFMVESMSPQEKKRVQENGIEGAVVSLSIELMKQSQKWTDIKYLRHFEEIK